MIRPEARSFVFFLPILNINDVNSYLKIIHILFIHKILLNNKKKLLGQFS